MNSDDLKRIRFENNLTQEELGNILGVSKQHISNMEKGRVNLTDRLEYLLEQHFDLQSIKTNKTNNTFDSICPYRMKDSCPCKEQFEIQYLDFLPQEARLSEISSIHVDTELVENHWRRKRENLFIIPMQGDSLSSYIYPCQNRDILIIDVSSNIPTREGLYVYSAHNNTMIFVAKLSQSVDGTIKVEKFEKNGEVTEKKITPEKQQEVDFRVIGRVVKNVSWTL